MLISLKVTVNPQKDDDDDDDDGGGDDDGFGFTHI